MDYPHQQHHHEVLALASFLQGQLDMVVTTAEFFPAGRVWDPPVDHPSALVTLQPYCPGGLARLVLNVRSPLVQEVARALVLVHRGPVSRAAVVVAMGRMWIHTGTWPVAHVTIPTTRQPLHWATAPGIIATPHRGCVSPVPHEECSRRRSSQVNDHNDDESSASWHHHLSLAIWPRRVCGIVYRNKNRGDPSSSPKVGGEAVLLYQFWRRREEGLRLEWNHLVRGSAESRPRNLLSSWWRPGSLRRRTNNGDDTALPAGESSSLDIGVVGGDVDSPRSHQSAALLTYSPSLPVFALAAVLANTPKYAVPRHRALAEATDFWIRRNRLFALSLLFGVPLMDRTRTVAGPLKVALVVRPPPTRAQVQDFCRRRGCCQSPTPPKENGSATTPPARTTSSCHEVLRTILLERACELWNSTEQGQEPRGTVYVAWSGGIDSTAVLCALLETSSPDDAANGPSERRKRLVVILDDESIVENPAFFKNFILAQNLPQRARNDHPLSWHEAEIRRQNPLNIMVTGELGDQLFGSDQCQAAFPTWDPSGGEEKLQAILGGNPQQQQQQQQAAAFAPHDWKAVFAEKGLAAPWEETVLVALADVGLLADGGPAAWKDWIAPQLAKAPLPIVSTNDFLWWMNFSLKWQNVRLRCWHDGGNPLLSRVNTTTDDTVTGCIRHFFDTHELECWSCVPEFHCAKFPDLRDWKTYKEPLKFFIRQFDGDDKYYREKTKVASLNFGAPDGADTYVNRFHGAVVDLLVTPQSEKQNGNDDEPPSLGGMIDPSSKPRLLSWGVCGMTVPGVEQVKHLLNPAVLAVLDGYPNEENLDPVVVNPWTESSSDTSPFNIMPEFAETDERQRRIFNPVTKNTLTGKCAALLTQDLLDNRTFLDLGSCLGASSHWALCMGAAKVTAVEVQESFCKRSDELFKKAEAKGCWAAAANVEKCYQVVCSGIREYLNTCSDASHDVVLAAGVLHCFSDPLDILREIARVSAHSVLLEMTHPGVYTDGYLQEPNVQRQQTGTCAGGEAFCDSVRPMQKHVERAGLLQVAPQALVNMADKDSSFSGFSVVPSRRSVEVMMRNLGFEVTRVSLTEHPTAKNDLLTYTGPRRYKALPWRYFLRCVRKTVCTGIATQQTLESSLVTNDRSTSSSWKNPPLSWFSSGSASTDKESAQTPHAQSSQTLGQGISDQKVIEDPEEKWSFDTAVACRFEREAKCHIPDYEDVVGDSICLLEEHLKEGQTLKESAAVVDVGCATGYTLVKLFDCGFQNIYGVDTSIPMIEQAKQNLQLVGKDPGEVVHLSDDTTSLPQSLLRCQEQFSAVLINWTLHFVVERNDRRSFLGNIAKHMQPGSLLVLTEKTSQNSLTQNSYYNFKRSNGVSEEEIQIKKSRLKGVLETFDVNWYFEILGDCGFIDVSIYRAKYGFVTFVARRKKIELDWSIQESPVLEKFKIWFDFSSKAENVRYEARETNAPYRMCAWGQSTDGQWHGGVPGGTVYGFVFEGPMELSFPLNSTGKQRTFTMYTNMYFACPGECQIRGGAGILCLVDNHKAMFSMGGPVEEGEGRLNYIDGCTDSLLLCPAVKGAPCLNHLHFPPGIVQTQHTHPSGRSGIVVRGTGTCISDDGRTRTPLMAGSAFVIPANVVHAFETNDEELDVIAFHPDSDFGPSSKDHPMINRTIVDGVSASKIARIQTRAH